MNNDPTGGPQPTPRRVPVSEAAEALGISEGAVRMRVKRGTLPSVREGGRLYVLLEHVPTTEPGSTHSGANDRTSELIATLREQLQAERQAHAEARRIIAGLVERMPAIEAPQDSPTGGPGSPEQGEAGEDRGKVPAEREAGDSGGVVRTVATEAAGNIVAYLVILGGGTALSAILLAARRVELSLIAFGVTIFAAVIHDFLFTRAVEQRVMAGQRRLCGEAMSPWRWGLSSF